MAAKKEENAPAEIDWSGADEMVTAESLGDGESVTGYYLGHVTQVLPMGPAQIHHFRTPEGKRRAVIGSSLLTSQLAGVTLGRLVMAERIGKMAGKRTVAYSVKVHPTLRINDSDDFLS